MPRIYQDWLPAFLKYAQHTESPRFMHFWSGVSAIAGALRRRVWIDQFYFRWTPNFFIVFVAPPGIVAKTTTADISMDLLREIPGVKFGPDIVTWPALITAFAGASEAFEWPAGSGDWHPMSALTLVSSELGNLLNPSDKEMVSLFINLWDGRKRLDKQTKTRGNDLVEAPWVNMIACTTPHWIADNMPPATVGGGFTSRCVFVYAEEKEKFIAYPADHVPKDIGETKSALIHDLEHISVNLVGEYCLDLKAKFWGEKWYENLWKTASTKYDNDQMAGYVARKQTHMHKLAIILAASQRDELIILEEDLQLADRMLEDIEKDMTKVFSRIGRTEDSLQAERFITFVQKKGSVPYEEAYRMIHTYFPDFKDFEGILAGAIRSGQVQLDSKPDGFWIKAIIPKPPLQVVK